MYCLVSCLAFFTLTHAASSGAKKCDALGLCTVPSSGAGLNAETGEVTCPPGMDLVSPPRRSDAYVVSTAPVGQTGPTSYTPGQWMDIYVTTVGPNYMKFLGILMYAVQLSDGLGPEGCPSPGCEGKDEVKLGSWEVTNELFQVSEPCEGQAVTHSNADAKPYVNIFRWKAPEAGSGDVMFRVVLKQGSTNMGHFWWPMTSGDLMLTEGPSENVSEWFAGDVSLTCTAICNAQGRNCDRSMPTGSLNLFDEHVGKSQSCQLPLLSTCSRTAPSRDEAGYCWFDNQDSGLCDQSLPVINICDALDVSGGSERLCPCIPTDEDGWLKQSTSAPSMTPSVLPSVSPSLVPSSAPSRWFDPRWETVYDNTLTCEKSQKISTFCKSGCDAGECRQACADNDRCKYYFFHNTNGQCKLFDDCSITVPDAKGVTVRKIVIPTNEPSFNPTVSNPTTVPTSSLPSITPTVSPSFSPSISQPSSSPSRWFDPRWETVFNGQNTCDTEYRISRFCNNSDNCSEQECQDGCADNDKCKYYFTRANGVCWHFSDCAKMVESKEGKTVRKIVIPTLEPSFGPTLSAPSTNPSLSAPTLAPSSSAPTTGPSAVPSKTPSKTPSKIPTISAPTKSPSTWNTPRWHIFLQNSPFTCSRAERILTPCDDGCFGNTCRDICAANPECWFFFKDNRIGKCELFSSCQGLRTTRLGTTWRKEMLSEPVGST